MSNRNCEENHNSYRKPEATVAQVYRRTWIAKDDISYRLMCNFHRKVVERRAYSTTEFLPLTDDGVVAFLAERDAQQAEYAAKKAKENADQRAKIEISGRESAAKEAAARFFVEFSPEKDWNEATTDRWIITSDAPDIRKWATTEVKIENDYGQPVLNARNTNGTLTPSEARAIAEMLLTAASIAERTTFSSEAK